ncbi:MAG: BatA domain-containing protein, partial [Planctomycetaceae bacterium]
MPALNHSHSMMLAMGFASPWLLTGLALAGIPIVLHFFYKRQYRETPWAAMRFLLEAARKHSRRLRLEQLLLLAVRVLILAFLATALARPYAELVGGIGESAAPVHRIVVIDSSLSMGFEEKGSTRFAHAQELIRERIREARTGDLFNIVRISGDSPQLVIGQPTARIEQVQSELDALRPTEERGDVVAALRQTSELATLAPEIAEKEILIVSDFQRENWQPETPRGAEEVRRLLGVLGSQGEVVAIDVNQGSSPNSAVTSLDTEEAVPMVGRDIVFRGMMRNYGLQPLLQQRVEIHVDGRLVEGRTVDLPAERETPIEFSHLFRESGEHLIELKLAGDALPIDNSRAMVLPVRDEISVLLVNGRPAGKASDAATYYLETVLSPTTARETWSGATRPRVIGDGELIQQNLNRFDCVSLCNVRIFTDREVALLRTYVESGGGLMIWLGDQVQAEMYNRLLYGDGKGVLPAQLQQRVGGAGMDRSAFGFDAESLEHPILRRFRGNPGTGLETTLTLEYFRLQLENQSGARVALRFDSGDPAIVESQIGQGRVIVIATSADVSWGTWPIQRSFPPLVHEMVRYAVAGRQGERQLNVGAPFVRNLPQSDVPTTARIVRPDEREVPLDVAIRENAPTVLTYRQADRSGVYQLELGPTVNRTEKF